VNEKLPDERPPAVGSPERRDFLRKAAGRSLAAVGVAAAAGTLLYEKPGLRSFLPGVTVYAQTTGAGKFTLKGTT
jgi:hypothetical protein